MSLIVSRSRLAMLFTSTFMLKNPLTGNRFLGGLMFLLACCSVPCSGQQQGTGNSEVYVIPFSHLDLSWACTQEECLSRGNFIISKAIHLAEENPRYRYVIESEVFVANFVESHQGTKELAEFRQLVKRGRIEISPLWAGIYQNQTRGEALVRNLIYGKRYAREMFGVDPTVAHLTDIPGFTRQYPQILSKAATPFMVMTRMGPRDLSLFHWKAPDGSSALAWNTINGYGWGVGLGLHLDLGQDRLQRIGQEIHAVQATTKGPLYMGWGTDLYAPSSKLIENTTTLNQQLAPMHFRLATAQEFFQAASAIYGIPDVSGEIPSSWANLTTSLLSLWLPAMTATDTLVSAEKFAAINYALGYAPYPDRQFESLWKNNLQAFDHNNDGQGGEIGDERKLEYARAASYGAGQILRDSLRNIAERVRDPFPRSTPIVVFNPLSWTRNDIVRTHLTLFGEVETGAIDDYKKGMRLMDEKATSIPFQVEQQSDGSSRSLDLLFIADGVPSVGYKTYYLLPADAPQTFPKSCDVKVETDDDARQANDAIGSNVLENEHYRVSVERATGRIEIFDKDLSRTVGEGIEIIGAEERGGDDQNIILRTGRRFPNSVDEITLEENGPIQTVLRIHGTLGGTPVIQRLTMYKNIKKIDIENTIEWKPGRSMSIEQIFPFLHHDPQVRNGVPFGTVTKVDLMPNAGPHGDDEVSREIWKGWRQIQDWVFAGNGDWGFTLSADHNLIEVSDTAITVDMLRGTRFSPVTTERNGQTIQDLRPPAGTYVFRYSFTSGPGGWTARKPWRSGMAFSAPLIPVSTANTIAEDTLPPSSSFLSFEADNLVLSAMKKADTGDSIVVRAFEIQGDTAAGGVHFLGQACHFSQANLLEKDLSGAKQENLRVKPYEIDTLKLPIR